MTILTLTTANNDLESICRKKDWSDTTRLNLSHLILVFYRSHTNLDFPSSLMNGFSILNMVFSLLVYFTTISTLSTDNNNHESVCRKKDWADTRRLNSSFIIPVFDHSLICHSTFLPLMAISSSLMVFLSLAICFLTISTLSAVSNEHESVCRKKEWSVTTRLNSTLSIPVFYDSYMIPYFPSSFMTLFSNVNMFFSLPLHFRTLSTLSRANNEHERVHRKKDWSGATRLNSSHSISVFYSSHVTQLSFPSRNSFL